MKKLLFLMLLSIAIIMPGYSQDKTETPEKKEDKKDDTIKPQFDTAYREVTLEDFETTDYTQENLRFRVSRDQKAGCKVRDIFPAPNGKSKKYLGIKIFGKDKDSLIIKPTKKLIIDKYCREISIWVYGKKFSGEFSIMLQDATGRNHRLSFGKLNFLGWRKLRVKLNKWIKQQDDFLSQNKYMEILHIQYMPTNMTRRPIWHYFYIDDITAMVRDKYMDRQSDDW